MKAKTVYLAVGLASLSALVSVSCGGESGSDEGSDTAGTSSTAGSGVSGGSAGSSSSSGGTSNAAGDGASAGTTSGGSGSSGGTGAAGAPNGGALGFAGAPDIGAAGAPFGINDCATGVADGEACTRAMGQINTCQLDATTYCTCSGRNNPTWQCQDLGGAGGAGGLGDVTCPGSPMTGNQCTGTGLCPGSDRCGCVVGTVICTP